LRVLRRRRRLGLEERIVFVVGSPRSGTTFLGESLGAQPGFVDLSEVTPLKAALPGLVGASDDEAARRIRQILERVRRLALARRLRAVEQTPEMSFFLASALDAYPQARAVHIVRDGRDVAASLLERGWLSDARPGADDAGLGYGPHARFWVEPERVDEFGAASEATRAAWTWRRYVTAASRPMDRVLEIRYETLAADPAGAATTLATHLGSDPEPLRDALTQVHTRSLGRWRESLSSDQVADIEREAGPLLRTLGYPVP
jgi:Sulfotransferase family